jgi:hypothetical protein
MCDHQFLPFVFNMAEILEHLCLQDVFGNGDHAWPPAIVLVPDISDEATPKIRSPG